MVQWFISIFQPEQIFWTISWVRQYFFSQKFGKHGYLQLTVYIGHVSTIKAILFHKGVREGIKYYKGVNPHHVCGTLAKYGEKNIVSAKKYRIYQCELWSSAPNTCLLLLLFSHTALSSSLVGGKVFTTKYRFHTQNHTYKENFLSQYQSYITSSSTWRGLKHATLLQYLSAIDALLRMHSCLSHHLYYPSTAGPLTSYKHHDYNFYLLSSPPQ